MVASTQVDTMTCLFLNLCVSGQIPCSKGTQFNMSVKLHGRLLSPLSSRACQQVQNRPETSWMSPTYVSGTRTSFLTRPEEPGMGRSLEADTAMT